MDTPNSQLNQSKPTINPPPDNSPKSTGASSPPPPVAATINVPTTATVPPTQPKSPGTPLPRPVTPPPSSPPPPTSAPPPKPSPSPLPSSPLPNINLPPAPTPSTASTPPPSKPMSIKKSPFRFFIPILAVAIIILLGVLFIPKIITTLNLGGSQTKVGTIDKPISLTYWGLWEPPEVMDELINQFEADNPGITVIYQQQSIKDYRERLQNALTNGQGPNIFRFHITWTSQLANMLDPIPSAVISSSDFEAQQYPVAKKWLKSGNNYLGIPLMYEGLGLYYNRTVFESAGKTPPKTWDDLRRTAILLTSKSKDGSIQRGGIALGETSNVDNWSDILGVMLLQNGANPAKPNDEAGQGALTFYTYFNKVDHVWDETMPSSTVAFATEKVAMMIAPSWRAHEVRSINPNLSFAIAPLPQLPNTQISWASIWADGVSAASETSTKDAAWKFLNYLNSKDTLRNWYAAASKQRLFGEIFSRIDMAEQLSTDPYVSSYLLQAPFAETWYLNSRTYDNGPNDKIIKYYEDAVNAVIKGDSPEKALATVDQGVAQIINQYRLLK